LLGTWEFTNATRDRTCAVTFHEEAARTGRRIAFDATCRKLYPFLADVAGWRMAENDFLRLLNPQGETILDFAEVESGVYEAPRPGEGILFIQTPGAGGPAPRSAELAAGPYAAVRNGKTLCALELRPAQADGDDNADGDVTIEKPCPGGKEALAPSQWRFENGVLTLVGADNQSWRFQEYGDTDWRAVEPANGILLVRR